MACLSIDIGLIGYMEITGQDPFSARRPIHESVVLFDADGHINKIEEYQKFNGEMKLKGIKGYARQTDSDKK